MNLPRPAAPSTFLPEGNLLTMPSSARDTEEFPKANILVVDDSPQKLIALEAVLEKLGHNIVKACSGKEALRCLLKQDFAVILLDVAMPVMDGFETAALIRARARSERTPIIFVTSFGGTEHHISRGYSLGAVDYLLAPVVPEVLCAKVGFFVEMFRQTEMIKQQARRLRALEQSRHEREMAQAAERLDIETRRNRFFTLAVDLLAIADFTPRLVQVNPSWLKVLGYDAEVLCARPLGELVHEEDRNAFVSCFCTSDGGDTPKSLEARFYHQDRSIRWLSLTVAPLSSERLFYIFAKDVTARKTAEDEVRSLNCQLEEKVKEITAAYSQMEALNYSIAHDLRAPLRSMSSFATVLLEDEVPNLSSQGRDFAARITHSAKYMDRLLQDLLAYARLGRVEAPVQDLSMDAELDECLALFSEQIQKCGARVERCSPLGSVRAHPPTFKQMLNNLVDNAIKFRSAERPLVLRFAVTNRDGYARLWVEDNGIGIPREHHGKIFGLFRRLHPTDVYEGTGVGLAIVRRAAEQMGGSAGLESEAGIGSKFWIELPAASERV